MDIALLVVAGLVAVAYVVVQVRSFATRHGAWRVAAALPLIGVGLVVGRVVADTRRDPTSHNLWPLEVLVSVAVALVALGLLAWLESRRAVGAA